MFRVLMQAQQAKGGEGTAIPSAKVTGKNSVVVWKNHLFTGCKTVRIFLP